MFVLGIIIICLGLLADILFPIFLGTFHITLSLCSLYLYFSVFRFSLKYTVIVLGVYVFLAYPFTSLSFFTIFFSYFSVLFIVNRLQAKVYTETYLGKAALVFLLSLAQMLLLHFVNYEGHTVLTLTPSLKQIFVQSCVNAMLSLPLFLVLDNLFDFLGVQGILAFKSTKRLVD